MARVNYSTRFVGETHVDLACDSCRHAVRGTRDQFRQWLLGAYDVSLNPFGAACPNCADPYEDWTPNVAEGPLENEFVKFGTTVPDVLAHRGADTDAALDANIAFILLDKEQRTGLKSFSMPERHVYAVQGMVREVNNGGFDQYFHNSSGELAFDLVPALEAMGSRHNLATARAALERFGKPRSLSNASRTRHLARLTKRGRLQLWDDLDERFYENPEDIEKMILDYIESNVAAFTA